MNRTTRLLAAATASLLMFQGCDGAKATAPGDRSDEGRGLVAFRISPAGLTTLRQTSRWMVLQISGPGMNTRLDTFSLDSLDFTMTGIPCGTRQVTATTYDSTGNPFWRGSDTVEVNVGAISTANIVLHRVQATGGLQVNLRLDDGTLDTLPRYDTVPQMHYPDCLFGYDSLHCRQDTLPRYDTVPRMHYPDSLFGYDSLHRRQDTLPRYDTVPRMRYPDSLFHYDTLRR